METYTGNRGLTLLEPLIFELDADGRTGVDLPAIPETPSQFGSQLGGLERKSKIGLPSLSEPQVVRHFTKLSQKNYSIDSGFFPLGSCTMKHNPRLNEKMARLPGFAQLHPLQPEITTQGALQLIDELSHWLKTLTGMPAVAMSPAAGAHGELCGMMAIKAAIEAKGEAATRTKVLVPESAHGTNPATAVVCGFTVEVIPADKRGRVDLEAFKTKLGPDVAGIMLTNPNTCGLFETDIIEIAKLLHDAGGYFYCDGANLNAIMGRVRPGDLGIDCMHINLHKTFSTPHGGGGPGSGPVVLSDRLKDFCPLPWIIENNGVYSIQEEKTGDAEQAFGRLKAFHGQMGMFIRALSYMLSHGSDGLKAASGDAVLNANYLRTQLQGDLSVGFDEVCMHEVVFSEAFLKDTGITMLDFVKALIDEGYHPPTMYFPLVVPGALLVEPTETESKETLDQFIGAVKYLAAKAKAGNVEMFKNAPQLTPLKRLDETQAARKPCLVFSDIIDDVTS